ncbi:MAG: DNA adenine methylase [Peptococcaceae bacterium]|nr:DNA adenine methylase [Peptococcaceae bacterium]
MRTGVNREDPAPRAQPVIKWAGGKRQLIDRYREFFPARFNAYHEPFLGGGAVFFHLIPPVSFLSDSNEELINMYLVIQNKVDQLIEDLSRHKNDRDYYYQIRSLDVRTLTDVQRASRLIYLNKTCYNGLYRVNRRGEFNVPFGKYKRPRFLDVDSLLAANRVLQRAVLMAGDFEMVLENARPGDFVYLDPPYYPVSRTSGFTDFTDRSFSAKDHERLSRTFDELAGRGCLVMLSNSDTPFVRELYAGYRRGIISLTANRPINSRADKRGPVGELIVCSWIK